MINRCLLDFPHQHRRLQKIMKTQAQLRLSILFHSLEEWSLFRVKLKILVIKNLNSIKKPGPAAAYVHKTGEDVMQSSSHIMSILSFVFFNFNRHTVQCSNDSEESFAIGHVQY